MATVGGSSGPDVVRGVQERAARALPAERVTRAGGWWLRYAPGCSWWAGAVLPHGGVGPGGLVGRVTEVEESYSGWGATVRFQISPGACPDGLDSALAERGYRREGLMSLQGAPTGRVLEGAGACPVEVRVRDRPTEAWFRAWWAVHGIGDRRSEWEMLARVGRPSAFACVVDGDEVVAVGRAVADAGWAGVFGMATLPRARGKGVARGVLGALAGWAAGQGADRMYLQVERGNGPALGLYGRAGFREMCAYHYRVAVG